MDKKRIVLFCLITFTLLAVFSINAYAENAWYTGCEVKRTGLAGTDSVILILYHPSFGDKWFSCRSGREKEMLAVCLTAQLYNGKVTVYTDPSLPTSAERIVYNMYYDN